MVNTTSTATIIIGIILGLVILFNIAAVFMAKNNQEKTTNKYKNYSTILNNLNNPYKNEDKDLEKLSKLVNQIKENNETEE